MLQLRHFLFIILFVFSNLLNAQKSTLNHLLTPADTFNSKRFYGALITGTTLYTSGMIGLNEIWYKQFPKSKFHFFNDNGEWENMDKYGHSFTTYFESLWSYNGARWVGIPRKKAAWLGAGLGLFYQTSIEVLDGFSEKWGFSTHDIAFNALGSTVMLAQELAWQEQRISLKFSAVPQKYDDLILTSENGITTTLQTRVDDLYGTAFTERLIKDYNAQSYWVSFNIYSFTNKQTSRFPKWINVAFGYGAQNMFGGFENEWMIDGETFRLSNELYPRYRQFFLSPDIDFTRIPTKSPLLKTFLHMLNVFKCPMPAVELNTEGNLNWHWLR